MGREFELPKEIELPASPEEVWQAIATGPGMAAWFMPMEIDPDSAQVAEWSPPHRLFVRTPEAPDGSTQAFQYLIEGRDGGTSVLRFVHSGVLGDDWDDEYEGMTSSGWDMYLFTLGEYLRHFRGRPATYAEAEAPAAGGWDRLLRALGTARLGSPVKIDLPGGPSLKGEVDYATAKFVGLRTPDALVRFHERSAVGLPIAVSDHHYGETGDPQDRAGSWQRWLAATVGDGAPL
ncbi:SRPBCC family protein [Amycolatopsis tucumanensis]|uniref:SRPBCC domain-containing protein n=1 Tax=Amycolatopsis tucumanensis TaxID=401106 RepID=A0ABP7JAM1_9PSEU|nr:SRPBCC domain-containing protein [Amycolatopsis tucumanensis]MCF6421755.1 SRPBCC domain-containing protein [Amycolatopsis tucumanensis]